MATNYQANRVDDRRPVLTQQQMEDYGIPLASRDECAHVLVKLQQCRVETFSLPWKCVEKRNAYFRCEEKDFVRRVHARTAEKQAIADFNRTEAIASKQA